MAKEEWRRVPRFPNYEASSLGRVRNVYRGRIYIKEGKVRRHGYLIVKVFLDGKDYYPPLHVLVLEAFRGPCPKGKEGSHLDGNRMNCRLDNLEWMTKKQNHALKRVHGTDFGCERNPAAKLTPQDVRDIREQCQSRVLTRELRESIAHKYGIAPLYLYQLRRSKTWRGLG